MIFFSHSQNFEDVLLWRCLQDVANGFYVDVGAYEPDLDSVTRAFSDRGWRGVNVEPALEPFTSLQRRRPHDVNLSVVAGREPGTITFFDVAGTGLSTADPTIAKSHKDSGFRVSSRTVPVLPLAEICRRYAPGEIHFLKIDCEGTEAAVLAGADFKHYRPWIILIEATAPNSQVQTHASWEPSLLAAGYQFAWFDGLNRFYVASEHGDRLILKIQMPPNVFDHFVRVSNLPAPATPAPTISQAAIGDPLLDTPISFSIENRIELARCCHDCDDLPRVADAGQVLLQPDGTRVQIMHNGLKVSADGYCGPWMTKLIAICRGHHEPQEERLFHQATLCLPTDATMIELGGNWSYYSAWFLQSAPQRRAVVLEPDPANRLVGEQTMRLNGLTATFVAGTAGATSRPAEAFETELSGILDLPCWSVPDLMAEYGMQRLDLLHCDTQGVEFAVLSGCGGLFRSGRIGLVFVSTHVHQISGDPLTHQRCLRFLQDCGAVIEAEHDAHESYSGDGLIVARFGPALPGWQPCSMSVARKSEALFRDVAYDLAAAYAGLALAETIVNDVFQALLFRDVEPSSRLVLADEIRRTGSARSLLHTVLQSAEFQSKCEQFVSRSRSGKE